MSNSEKRADVTAPCSGEGITFDAKALDNLLKRRFFVAPSFEIYGSAAGLFDFGPCGCAVKNELEAFWRRHFVLEEDLLEISGPNLTPHAVLKASGHVDRFLDLMVEDVVTKECFRCDKLIEDWLERNFLENVKEAARKEEVQLCLANLEGASADQMDGVIKKYGIKSPQKNDLSFPYPFNLMFGTKIGPKPGNDESGIAYLRPETAQGIFVNFRRLLEQNGRQMPFGAACVGTSFRNEIAPRNGLLRVREFPMAEIEFFCDPIKKAKFPKYELVKDVRAPFYPRARQVENLGPVFLTIGEAVQQGIIDNETLAYFIGRTYLFLEAIGINPNGLRFRQHLDSEMAHYASDCWDAEILTSYKWVECVGIADRSAFDLTQHTMATKVDLQAARPLLEPRVEEKLVAKPNRKALGPKFKKDLQEVLTLIDGLTEENMQKANEQLTTEGKCELKGDGMCFELTQDLLTFEKATVKITEEAYTPNVIEPSFGIGRIFYALLEHAFRKRGMEDQEDRNYLALSPLVAPIKCSILPISNQPQFVPIVESLRKEFLKRELSSKVDSSNASIGKRYARTDEVGIPYGITVDFQTVEDNTVTLREIVSMSQIRIPLGEVPDTIRKLVRLEERWEEVRARHPAFVQQQLS